MRHLPILAALLLAGCAGNPPLDATGINTALTPREAAAAEAVDQDVLWGGVIVNASNLADATRLEILAYPLGRNQRPQRDEPPLGRFLAFYPGYLETADYAAGRLVTVTGTLEGVAQGQVGQADYTYPVVETDNLELWPRETPRVQAREPRVNFGIGIILGR